MTAPVLDAQLIPSEERAVALKNNPELSAYPKPTHGDIQSLWKQLQGQFDPLYQRIVDERDVRYMRDETPIKWKRFLQDGRRFHSRMSHNEIMRIAAMLARNPPIVSIRPGGEKQSDVEKALKQTRWANELFKALERQSGNQRVMRPMLDNTAGDGLGVVEIYMKDDTAHDRVDPNAEQIYDDKIGDFREETPREINKRVDAALVGAPLPFGWRRVSPLSYMTERDNGVNCRTLIIEYKPYRAVYEKQLKKKGEDLRLPKPGTRGWEPFISHVSWYDRSLANFGGYTSNAAEGVITIRYYDKRWYAYIVGGVLMDGPTEHKLPGVPVFECPGMLTGSDDITEAYQGVTTGMTDMERAVNDMMTLALDSAYTFSRPRPVGVAPPNTMINGDPPANLDLSGEGMPFLPPGYDVKDAFAGFEPRMTEGIIGQIMSMFQRSGINPITAGESPGSDVAGYTVNTLTQSAQSLYEVILENLGIMYGQIVDFVRLMVRDTVKEKVYLSTMSSPGSQDTEWLVLSPDDVDETPSEVIIDPMAEANRMAMVAQKAQLNKQGFIPRREVQRAAGADDPELWDNELVIDAADEAQMQKAIDMADQIIAVQAQQKGLMPPAPPPQEQVPPGGVQQPGIQTPGPAPTPGPTVGASNTGASQQPFATSSGPPAIAPATQRAGQARP